MELIDFRQPMDKEGCQDSTKFCFGFIRAGRQELRQWHKRLFGYISTAIECGFMDQEKKINMLKIRPVEEKSTSSKREGAEETALRLACGNQLGMATVWMLDDRSRSTLAVVVECTMPLDSWHSVQNTSLRTTSK